MHVRPFEIALIGFFILAGILGVFVMSKYQSTSTSDQLYGKQVVIWGTLEKRVFDQYLIDLSHTQKALNVVTYTQVDPRSFETQLVNALAEGRAPDLVIIPHTALVSFQKKLQPISFKTLSERTFHDTYIDGADIFMRSDGVYGIPFAVDPLVMYWNKDLFSSAGIAQPPQTWETLLSQTTKALVKVNDASEISQSAVAFGQYNNVTHAKDILAMLLLQSGNTLVEEKDGVYRVTLSREVTNGLNSGVAVLNFYTQFALPSSPYYSWNRAKENDRDAFIAGTLGMYFGKGSERHMLERSNANLNFDITRVPQGSNVTTERNYGDFYAFAIPRAGKNPIGAYNVAMYLSDKARVKALTDALDFAPVHRTLYTGGETDPFTTNIYKSALIARGWLDPSPEQSDAVFRAMIEEVLSGSTRTASTLSDAVQKLEALFQ